MDLDVVMRSNDCQFIVKFYGALFKEVCHGLYRADVNRQEKLELFSPKTRRKSQNYHRAAKVRKAKFVK